MSSTPPSPDSPAPPAVRRTNGFSIASLVLGILSITGPLFLVGAVLALVFGYRARREIELSHGVEEGRGFAVAGIVMGWVGLGITVFWIIIGIVAFSVMGS